MAGASAGHEAGRGDDDPGRLGRALVRRRRAGAWGAAAAAVALAIALAAWLWLDEWLVPALISWPAWLKLALAKLKLAALVLLSRTQWFVAKQLPRRFVRTLLWIAIGTRLRRLVRKHYHRRYVHLRAAVLKRRMLVMAVLGAVVAIALATHLWLGLSVVLLILPVRALRYVADWIWSHGGAQLMRWLRLDRAIPLRWRRLVYRRLMIWRRRLRRRVAKRSARRSDFDCQASVTRLQV